MINVQKDVVELLTLLRHLLLNCAGDPKLFTLTVSCLARHSGSNAGRLGLLASHLETYHRFPLLDSQQLLKSKSGSLHINIPPQTIVYTQWDT